MENKLYLVITECTKEDVNGFDKGCTIQAFESRDKAHAEYKRIVDSIWTEHDDVGDIDYMGNTYRQCMEMGVFASTDFLQVVVTSLKDGQSLWL